MELTRLEFYRLMRLVRQTIQFLDHFGKNKKNKEEFETILKKLEWKFDREYNKGMQ